MFFVARGGVSHALLANMTRAVLNYYLGYVQRKRMAATVRALCLRLACRSLARATHGVA
jgi:membrane protein YqaA with SNARE-associated domain